MRRYSLLAFIFFVFILLTTACDDPTRGTPNQDAEDQNFDFFQIDAAATCPITVDANKELMIRDISVVNDPVRTVWTGSLTDPSDGAWHFGRLMANLAGDRNVSDFIRTWLGTWETDRTVNTFVLPNRADGIRQEIIDAWPRLPDGKLDPTQAPFRLLAIVNRIDLRNVTAGNAGEGRFVFGALDPQGATLRFTVIFEFKLLAANQAEALQWAEDWHALSALSGPDFNTALQAITDRFSGKNVAPTRRNGSALGQVRTNEIDLGTNNLWDMREFSISASSNNRLGQLALKVIDRTPDARFNNSDRLSRFINQKTSPILRGVHGVTTVFENERFQAGAILYARTAFWNGAATTPITNPTARHLFSVNTCNGCHARETDTVFLHVEPRSPNGQAQLSGFLTGITVLDPVNGTSRTFNDLERRSTDLKNLLCPASAAVAVQQTINRVH